jgi:hypothetical protein
MILTNEIQRDQRYRALGLEVIVAKELAAIRSVMQRAPPCHFRALGPKPWRDRLQQPFIAE